MTDLVNYLGQLRIYSIIDLVLLLVAAKIDLFAALGILLLHISFLFYLESVHKHKYRKILHPAFWIIIGLIGLVLYRNLAVLGFFLFSFLYAEKHKFNLGAYSPLFRGLQMYFLIGGLTGFSSQIALLSFALLTIRNLLGDLRDVNKDKKEKLNSIPVLLKIKGNFKYIHLVATLVTSFVWWYIANISLIWLGLSYILEILTYNITTR